VDSDFMPDTEVVCRNLYCCASAVLTVDTNTSTVMAKKKEVD
jgi:hypothetical protein